MSITDIIDAGEAWLAKHLGITNAILLGATDEQVSYQVVTLPRQLNNTLINIGAEDLERVSRPDGTKVRRYLLPNVGKVELEYTRKGKYMRVSLIRLEAVIVPLSQMSVEQLQDAARAQSLHERGPEYEFAINAKKLHSGRRDLLVNALTDIGITAVDVSGAEPIYVR